MCSAKLSIIIWISRSMTKRLVVYIALCSWRYFLHFGVIKAFHLQRWYILLVKSFI